MHRYRGVSGRLLARRWFLQQCGVGLGAIAAQTLAAPTAHATPLPVDPLALKASHIPPRVKNVIFLFQAGAPSHLELFDYKPQLERFDGSLPPAELLEGYRAAFINPQSKLLGPRYKFAQHGKCGSYVSELLPHTAKIVDDIAIVRSMKTDAFNHAPAQVLMSTGSLQFGKPCLGAWTLYGLGSESQNLPGFVVFSTGKKGPSGGTANWGSGYLPTVYQGVPFSASGDPVLFLSNPPGVDRQLQRDSLDVINQLNRRQLERYGDPEIHTRINSFEMAYRMQASAPEAIDVSQEPQHILDMYGNHEGDGGYARCCLLARRLVERGVRFVEIFNERWDQHGNLKKDIALNCLRTDQATAALLQDLKQRGLLDETLVVWASEFGRTPGSQHSDGRDHHPFGFTVWMAGGGIKGGIAHGNTDELGFHAVENRHYVTDVHATVLHQLGLDPRELVVPGRKRLEKELGQPIHEVIA
ncbi:MAG: DUF1501 domain-containing protein [Planctomycetales bacterium]|nr:DUF1501 domain-containing protein [Planctomycetales bacterium]